LSLEEIELHPFIACNPSQIPKSIPQSATHVKPEWRSSKKGAIYAANSASKSLFCRPNISKDTGKLESRRESSPSVPTAEESNESEGANVEEGINNDSLTPDGEARAAFFVQERAHQQLYTKAMVEWGVAEYARTQTQERRRANKNDKFSRAFVDPEEVKMDTAFMELLTKKCDQAYKSLYGHRTGGTVQILDNVDANVLGKYGKIVAVETDPNDPEKIAFKIEIQEKRVDGIISYATARPSDIEVRNKTDGCGPKKSGKKGKRPKKKGGKCSSAAKSGPPSEHAINLKPVYDLDVVITKSALDSVTSEPSGMTYILDGMMAKRNEEEERKELKLQRLKEESKKAELEALEKETLSDMNEMVKLLKKKARRIRSEQNKERVSLSERFELDVPPFISENGDDDLLAVMFETHQQLFLDSLTDFFDVLECREMGIEFFDLLASTESALLLMKGLYHPDEMPAILGVLACHVDAVAAGDRVILLFENFAFASVDASDPRLAFIKMKVFREMDDEEMEEEYEKDLLSYAELLGVPVDADANAIKKAFRKHSMQCHPDKAGSNGLTVEQAEEKFKALSEAKTALLASLEKNE
jgi:hypothetical protein